MNERIFIYLSRNRLIYHIYNMKHFVLTALAVCFSLATYAQQALWSGESVVSPDIHADNTVTFRYRAPKAVRVQVTGDFLPNQLIEVPGRGQMESAGVADMKEVKDGVWEFTTPAPLDAELYSYSFIVDGLKVMDPANVYMNRDVASVTNIFIVSKEKGDKGDLYKVNDVPHGTVSRIWYNSPSLNMNRRLTVYTPAGYETSKQKYPVFYLLHGAGGDEEAWIALGRTAQILDNLIATGKAKPMIVVMTNGNAWQDAAAGESPRGMVPPSMRPAGVQTAPGAFEMSFPDVIKFVEKTYRVKADKKNRAIAGLSMGSFHSENISKYYPDTFGYVGLFSGANVGNGGMGGQQSECPVYTDFDGKMATQFAKKPQLYFIACGKTDFVKKGVDDLRAYLTEHNYPFEYMETEGGHIWRNWRIYLSAFAPKLF